MTDLHVHQSAPQSPGFKRYAAPLVERYQGWSLGLPSYVNVPSGDIPTVVAVGGGKGGVGKSIVSANLSAKLAAHGYRVLVVDLDLGCANLHTHYGIPKPQYSLNSFLFERHKTFPEIITPTSCHGVALVAGGQEAAWGRHLAHGPEALSQLWHAILRAKVDLQVDFVLLDLGAGTMRHTMDFFATAHMGICTVLPEPTSVENAYVFLKSHLWHVIDNVAQRTHATEAAAKVRAALTQVGAGKFMQGYADCFRKLSADHPEFIGDVFSALRGRSVGLIVNQARSQADNDIGGSMELICQRYFGLRATFLASLNYDDAAWKSLRNRRLMLADFPHSSLAKKVNLLATKVLAELGYC